jgi:hypothetical protein
MIECIGSSIMHNKLDVEFICTSLVVVVAYMLEKCESTKL